MAPQSAPGSSTPEPLRRRGALVAVAAVAIVSAACGGSPAPVGQPRPTREETGPTAAVRDPAAQAVEGADEAGGTDELDPSVLIGSFDASRSLERLSVPILDCVVREDTDHPVFHGCVDWHSAVHGVFALHVAFQLSADPVLRDQLTGTLEATLDPDGLARELERLAGGELDSAELPYGFAWLLWADVARREAFGRDDLRPLAEEAAERLDAWLTGVDPELYRADAYDSAAWAAASLHRWYRRTGAADRAAVLADRVGAAVSEGIQDGACAEASLSQFFSPCHMVALVLSELGIRPVSPTLDERVRHEPALLPGESRTAHSAGLNFSRSWSLLSRWGDDCDDTASLALAADYFTAHLDQPERWRDDYRAHAHWVPQFGVLSLLLLEEGRLACGA